MTTSVSNPVRLALKRTLKLIQKGWTRGTFARDKAGRFTDLNSKAAARFCLSGALNRACPDMKVRVKATALLSNVVFNGNIIAFNDSCDHKNQVIKAVKKAIKLA